MLTFLIAFSIGMALIIGGTVISGKAKTRKVHECGAIVIVVGVFILLALTFIG
jgi:hypothetical protein